MTNFLKPKKPKVFGSRKSKKQKDFLGNKKANEGIKEIMRLILVLLVIVVVILGAYLAWKYGIFDKFKNLFPDWIGKEEDKKIAAAQAEIPEEERVPMSKIYPSVRLIYKEDSKILGDSSDFFTFRWNPNINYKTGGVQVVARINKRNWIPLESSKVYSSDEWLINPNSLKEFMEGKGISGTEKENIMNVMIASSEYDMLSRIAGLTNEENVKIDFPLDNWLWSGFSETKGRGYEEQMSTEEIKLRLMLLNQEYYKDEIKTALEEGKGFKSSKIQIYFHDDRWNGADDLAIVRWNFESQKAELAVRPNGEILGGADTWINNKEDMLKLLTEKGKLDEITQTQAYPALRFMGEFFDATKPSELTKKIQSEVFRDWIYTKSIEGIAEERNERMDIIDINWVMYGCEECNPDELFQIEEEAVGE